MTNSRYNLKVAIDLTMIDALCLLRACYCRRDEIDAKMGELLADIQLSGPDEKQVSAMIVLDGERYLVEQVIEKLWKASKPKVTLE